MLKYNIFISDATLIVDWDPGEKQSNVNAIKLFHLKLSLNLERWLRCEQRSAWPSIWGRRDTQPICTSATGTLSLLSAIEPLRTERWGPMVLPPVSWPAFSRAAPQILGKSPIWRNPQNFPEETNPQEVNEIMITITN